MRSRRLVSVVCATCAVLAACATVPPVPPGKDPARHHHELGLEHLGAGRLQEAREAFELALEEDPGLLDAVRASVDVERRAGRLPQVLPELKEAVEDAPKDPLRRYALGIALFASGAAQLEPALAELRAATELAPNGAEYWLRLGVALLEAERWPEARPPLERAVQLDPAHARGYLPLGICLYRLGDRPAALATLAKVLEHAPDPRDVQLAARTVERMYDPFRTFPQVLNKELEEAVAWVERADAPRLSLDRLELMLEKFPDQAVLHALAGLCYERLDDSGRAIESFRRAVELAPEDPKPRLYLADLYHTKEKLDVAAGHYEDVLERNPFVLQARRRLGQYALLRGDAPAAVRHMQIAVWLVPASPQDRSALARALALAGDLEGATRELARVTDMAPDNLEAWMQLGQVLLEMKGRSQDAAERHRLSERATAALEKVLDAQPQNAAAAKMLGAARTE